MTPIDASNRQSFARRLIDAIRAHGLSVFIHVAPYSMACAIAVETALRARAVMPVKVAIMALAILLFHASLQVGATNAASRHLVVNGYSPAPVLRQFRAALWLLLEVTIIGLVVALVATASIGLIDLAIWVMEGSYAENWPWMLSRWIATAAALVLMMILNAAAIGLVLSAGGTNTSLSIGLMILNRRSTEAGLVLCAAILGSALLAMMTAIALIHILPGSTIAAMLAKAVGLSFGATLLSISAVTLVARS